MPVSVGAWDVLLDGLLHAREAGRAGGVGERVLVSPWDGLLHVVLLQRQMENWSGVSIQAGVRVSRIKPNNKIGDKPGQFDKPARQNNDVLAAKAL